MSSPHPSQTSPLFYLPLTSWLKGSPINPSTSLSATSYNPQQTPHNINATLQHFQELKLQEISTSSSTASYNPQMGQHNINAENLKDPDLPMDLKRRRKKTSQRVKKLNELLSQGEKELNELLSQRMKKLNELNELN